MKYLSICSGIEAATVAWEPLGWRPVAFSEIEAFPSAVLESHYPNVSNLGDMTKIEGAKYAGSVDVLVGGTPCQAFSVAGLRAGLIDPRGNLTLVFAALADDIAPPFVVWENVPGVLSSKDNAFGCFLGLLAGEDDALVAPGGKWTDAGYVLGPQRTVAWRVLDAKYFGLAQRRRRVFVVACPRGGADPREILFEREGLRRDTAPSREAGQGFAHDVAPCIGASGRGFERGGDTSGSASWRLDFESETFAVSVALRGREGGGTAELGGDCGHALRASGGGGDKPHVLVFHPTQDPISSEDGSTHALGCGSKSGTATCAVAQGMQVRRLTPRECERLQGFPDDYTLIPWRGKESVDCPDGPRYKAIGNSFAVPVVRWIGKRIAEYEVKHGRYQGVFSSQTVARRRG